MPEISVIVPIYKAEQYLRRCVDSILLQTFSDFELILVDDGSPDSCGRICDEYAVKDSRVRVIHRENGGQCAARNSALDVAGGRYISFCDADDYLAENYLETLYSKMIQTGADTVSGGFIAVREDGSELYPSNYVPLSKRINTEQDLGRLMISDILGMRIGWEVCLRLFRADIIAEHHLRFYSCFGEDLLFVLEYLLFCRSIETVDARGYYYTQRSGSTMQFGVRQVRLNAINNISFQFGQMLRKTEGFAYLKSILPIIHYYILYNQYKESNKLNGMRTLSEELKKLENRHWYDSQTAALYGCKRELRALVGKEEARKAILITRFCQDGNWRKYKLLSTLCLRENRRYYLKKLLGKA